VMPIPAGTELLRNAEVLPAGPMKCLVLDSHAIISG